VGKAGSGLHIHTRIMKNGKSQMIEKGVLSDIAKRAIAGYIKLAPSLTAFGNMTPTSFFRLVPHQEAPTNICWGDRNRSVLVRVPLGWATPMNMINDVNPQEKGDKIDFSDKQTVEFRSPDGSADIYLLLAGLTIAAKTGLQMEDALSIAEKTYVDINIFDEEHKDKLEQLDHLPASCVEAAKMLKEQMEYYTKDNVFPKKLLETLATRLEKFDDEGLIGKIQGDDEKVMELVQRHFNCG